MRQLIATNGPPAIPPPLCRPIGAIAILSGLTVVVLGAQHTGDIAAGRLDRWAQTAVIALWPEPGLGAIVIGTAGDPLWVAVLTGLLAAACLALGRRRLAVVAVVGVGMTGIVTTALKQVVGRTIHEGFLSYPSGHTAAATVLTLVMMLLLISLLEAGRLPGLLLILIGTGTAGSGMALAQVVLDVHYATDTLGGFCTALVVVPATAFLVDRLADDTTGAEH